MTGNEKALDTLPARDGRLSEIASFAKRISWDIAEARKQFPSEYVKLIDPTITAWKAQLRSLREVDPKLDGSLTRKVKMAFLPIGAKMRPDMDSAKAEVWASAIVAALSDLPLRCILSAMDKALHTVFEFPTQMEGFVRSSAEQTREDEWKAIQRLAQLRDAFFGTQPNLPKLEDRRAEPLLKEQVRDIVRISDPAMAKVLIDLGLKLGSIDPVLLAQVQAEEADATA